MGEKTEISWADHTFNAWIGCTKVSEACHHCYAERDFDHRLKRVQWGPKGDRVLTSDQNWKLPLRWNKAAADIWPGYRRVFCNSLSDVMDDHPSIKPEWRTRLWELMRQTPNLKWLPLTKRPENWERFFPLHEEPMLNAFLGVSIENQERADERAPFLKMVGAMGWRTFVSYEPACGPVDWEPLMPWIDWLIAGGESGLKARPAHPAWFRAARDACARHRVPFHFKQWGEWSPVEDHDPKGCKRDPAAIGPAGERHYASLDNLVRLSPEYREKGWAGMCRIGKKNAGHLLDGVLHDAVL